MLSLGSPAHANSWSLKSDILNRRYEKNILSVVSRVALTQVLIFTFCNTCSQTLFYSSFYRYRGTDYLQQKKQHNQTIKLLGELYSLVPLVFFLVMTVPAERPGCRDTHSIHTPHYCGQFRTVISACKVSSHRSQRRITQHSLSLHFHCFMFWAANPYWLSGLAELLHDLTVCFIPRERKPFHFLQI